MIRSSLAVAAGWLMALVAPTVLTVAQDVVPDSAAAAQRLAEAGPTYPARERLAEEGVTFDANLFVDSCSQGALQRVRLFLEAGMSPDSADEEEGSCLVAAAFGGHPAVAEHVIAQGASPDIRDKFGATPLMHAASQGYASIVTLLLEAGADVNASDDYLDWTPLIYAAYDGWTEIVAALIDAGANPNFVSETNHYTALMLAAHQGYRETVETLVNAGADASLESGFGWTAEEMAERNEFDDIVRFLKDHR